MEYLRNRPIVTGYQRPTFFNRALPRLKPQPAHISMMIFKRRKQREQRLELFSELKEHLDDVRREATFEKMLFRTAQTKQTGSLIKPTRGSTLENSLHPSWDKCLEEWGTFSSILHIQGYETTFLGTYWLARSWIHKCSPATSPYMLRRRWHPPPIRILPVTHRDYRSCASKQGTKQSKRTSS